MFDRKVYDAAFDLKIADLIGAEKITRAILLDLSRTTLEAIHATEDIGYANRIINALTPVNKKVAVLYFKAFSGFHYSAETQSFTKKDKKEYEAKQQAAMEFLDDPLNNIWSWAAREVEVEAKEFDEERMKKSFESILKKAGKANFDQAQVVRSFISAGLKVETLLALIDELAQA